MSSRRSRPVSGGIIVRTVQVIFFKNGHLKKTYSHMPLPPRLLPFLPTTPTRLKRSLSTRRRNPRRIRLLRQSHRRTSSSSTPSARTRTHINIRPIHILRGIMLEPTASVLTFVVLPVRVGRDGHPVVVLIRMGVMRRGAGGIVWIMMGGRGGGR